MSKSVILKELPKRNGLETANLYIKDAVVFYPVVHEPKLNYAKDGKEYSITVFVDEETKEYLLDEVMVNKVFAEVGVDKTSKPPRRIKYPLSDQVDEDKVNYDAAKGLFGFNVARPEFSKAGNRQVINVIDTEGEPFAENVGNGSVCTLKLFGYRNQDGQLVVMLDTVQVKEHVPFEGGGNSGVIEDEVLGSYSLKRPTEDSKEVEEEQEQEEPPKKTSKAKSKKEAPPEPDFDDSDLPF